MNRKDTETSNNNMGGTQAHLPGAFLLYNYLTPSGGYLDIGQFSKAVYKPCLKIMYNLY